MTSSWLSRKLSTIYRQDTKWGPDLMSQVLQVLQLSNFVGIEDMTQKAQGWCHHDSRGLRPDTKWEPD